jgi:hypothetical protein
MAVRFHNQGAQPIHVDLEPSGHSFELAPGERLEMHTAPDVELTIRPVRDLLVEGFPTRVTQDGVELASWQQGKAAAGRVGSADELRAYLTASGQKIFADPEGATVFREVGGKPSAVKVVWSEEKGLTLVQGPGVLAKPEREEALAQLLTKINGEIAIPGWRLWPPSDAQPMMVVNYAIVLFQDEQRQLAHNVVDRALKIAFDTCAKYFPRLDAVAHGKPDPG